MTISKVVYLLLVTITPMYVGAYKRDSNYLKAEQHGALTRIILHVRDDFGVPVENADVKVLMGMMLKVKSYYISGVTDSKGLFVIEGVTKGNEIIISVSKSGYYSSKKKLCYIEMGKEHDANGSRWLPWPLDEEIEVRKIRNPVRLKKNEKTFHLSRTNQWIGVDMEVGDFIAPHGSGRCSDFEMMICWDGLDFLKSKVCFADIRFEKAFTGGYFVPKVQESTFPHVYVADTNLITVQKFRIQNRNGDFYTTHNPFSPDMTFVMRSRCVIDETGCLKNANYGCLRELNVTPGDVGSKEAIVYFYSVFNPIPNDTNLEALCR